LKYFIDNITAHKWHCLTSCYSSP